MALALGKIDGCPALFDMTKGVYAMLPETPFEIVEGDFGGIVGARDKSTGKEIDLDFHTLRLDNGMEITLDGRW